MNIVLNGQSFMAADGCSVAALAEQLHLAGKRYAVEINGDIVPRSIHHETRLHEGDRVEIVQAIGGG